MSEEARSVEVNANNSVRFQFDVGMQGDDLATIGGYVVLPGLPNVRWSRWAFSKCDETGVEHVVFASLSGATAVVDAASVARPSLEGLRLYGETVLRLRRRGQTSSALLWACVVDRLVALGLVGSGGSIEPGKLSAVLLKACEDSGRIS